MSKTFLEMLGFNSNKFEKARPEKRAELLEKAGSTTPERKHALQESLKILRSRDDMKTKIHEANRVRHADSLVYLNLVMALYFQDKEGANQGIFVLAPELSGYVKEARSYAERNPLGGSPSSPAKETATEESLKEEKLKQFIKRLHEDMKPVFGDGLDVRKAVLESPAAELKLESVEAPKPMQAANDDKVDTSGEDRENTQKKAA